MLNDDQAAQVPQVFRAMLPDGKRPRIGMGRNMLSARVPIDVKPDHNDCVKPGKGMSVFRSVEEMYPFLIPPSYIDRYPEASGGDPACKLWRLGTGPFVAGAITDDLALCPGSGNKSAHGEIAPSRAMHVDAYQKALAATQDEWTAI